MAVQTHLKPTHAGLPPLPELRVLEPRRRATQLHLFTYIVGNALFWMLLAAISVTAGRWYWWPIIPVAGWALVLAGHLWHVHRRFDGLGATVTATDSSDWRVRSATWSPSVGNQRRRDDSSRGNR